MQARFTGSTAARLGEDAAQSATALSTIRAQAGQLHAEYLAAAASMMTQFNLPAWWGSTEGFRKYPEGALALSDIATLDHWIAWANEIGLVPRKALEPVDESLAEISELMARGAPPDEVAAALVKGGTAANTAGSLLDAQGAFAPAWVKALQRSSPGLEWGGRVLGVAGILADTADIISPQDSGAAGWVDRGAAAVNGGFLTADLLGADAVMSFVPGVGEVAIAVTGIYLAGDFLYHHFTPFHDVINDIGHAVVTAPGDVGGAITAASENVSHDASAAWHSITSAGSWL